MLMAINSQREALIELSKVKVIEIDAAEIRARYPQYFK